MADTFMKFIQRPVLPPSFPPVVNCRVLCRICVCGVGTYKGREYSTRRGNVALGITAGSLQA